MIRKINLLSIAALLLAVSFAQIAWTKPTAQEDLCLLDSKHESTKPSENDSELSTSSQLLKFIAYGLQKLTLRYANGGKSISEQLLKDNELLSSKSPKFEELKQNLTKFEKMYTECDGLDSLFELAETYSNTTSFYYELEESTMDADSKLILNLLRKYKSEELDKEFEKYFDVFVADFDKKFLSLKDDLKAEQNELSKKLLDWFDHFKTLTTYDDKIEAFEQFFELF